MARGDQAIRQWTILTTIMAHSRFGITKEAILEEIKGIVSRGKANRTFQRDLQTLSEAGFPINRSQRDAEGRVLYRIEETFRPIPPIAPAVHELIALAVARSLLSMYEGTPFKDSLDSLWRKIQPLIPPDGRGSLEEALGMFGTLDRPALDYAKYKGLIEELKEAIASRRQLKMIYYSPRQGKDTEYTIDPIMFFTYLGILYVAAYTYRYREVRHFRLDRIRKVAPTGLIFSPRTYSLEELKNEAFGMIREEPFEMAVRFDSKVAEVVRQRVHHPSQRFEALPDGDVVMTIKAGGWDEMKWWVLSYSYWAEVLKPEAMRAEIQDDLKKALENYTKSK